MTHLYFKQVSRNTLILNILEIYEFNNECCSMFELRGYSKKELRYILSKIKYTYNNIDKKTNIFYN